MIEINDSDELLKLLCIAQDYLKQHWDMKSEPLNQIRLRLLKSDAQRMFKTIRKKGK